jgi:hypothetical protein
VPCTRRGGRAGNHQPHHQWFRKLRACSARAGLASPALLPPDGLCRQDWLHGPGGPQRPGGQHLPGVPCFRGRRLGLTPPTIGFPIRPRPGSGVRPGRRLARCRGQQCQAKTTPYRCRAVPAGSSAVVGAAGSAGRPNPAAPAIPEVPAASAEAAALPPDNAPSARVPPSTRGLSACPAAMAVEDSRAAADFLALTRHHTTPASTTSRMIKKTASMAIPSVGLASSFARRYVGSTSLSSTLTCRDSLFRTAAKSGLGTWTHGFDSVHRTPPRCVVKGRHRLPPDVCISRFETAVHYLIRNIAGFALNWGLPVVPPSPEP